MFVFSQILGKKTVLDSVSLFHSLCLDDPSKNMFVDKTFSQAANDCNWFIVSHTSLGFSVLRLADVETVRSLVEEMETDSRDDMTDNDPVEQGIGKRVIGELLVPMKGPYM